jgi:hypothetical protein
VLALAAATTAAGQAPPTAPAPPAVAPVPPAPEACTPRERRPGPAPAWWRARRATVLVDSVLLGGVPQLREAFPGWRMPVMGRPAIMLPAAEQQVRAGGRIAPLAVVGVGYNSLWERGRRNYRDWADRFDAQARALVRALRARGAAQVVWVTLREAGRAVIPSRALWQHDAYAWYFPYVNERLRRLDRRRDDLVLADWAAVSKRRGITYDAIHLNPDGGRLMARTIRRAVDRAARAQTPPPRCR